MIKNIIFAGGGLKGWAYIGTIKALNEFKIIDFKEIEQIIGVSAGAIFGLFYLLKLSPEYLLDYFINLDFNEMVDTDIDNIFNLSLTLVFAVLPKEKPVIIPVIDIV